MKRTTSVVVWVLLPLALWTSASGQSTQKPKDTSPFDKYRQSTASELPVRMLRFDLVALQMMIAQRGLLTQGFVAPTVEGETSDGKLLIEADIYSSELPKTVDDRKQPMLFLVNIARAAFSSAFGLQSDFERWARVVFSDTNLLTNTKGKAKDKPIDPVIGIYENGELVLR